MEKSNFTREERADISKKFREEIASHGLANSILSVLQSQSAKVEVKKTVLMQQCRKKDFAKKFKAACEDLRVAYPSMKMELRAFARDICPSES